MKNIRKAKSTISKSKSLQRDEFLRTKKNTWSSYKERKGNALALGADEGRDKLRKAAGSRK